MRKQRTIAQVKKEQQKTKSAINTKPLSPLPQPVINQPPHTIKRLKSWRVVFQCWKLISTSIISIIDVTTWTYREFLIVSQTINQKKRLLKFLFRLMLKSKHLILRTVMVWVSQRKWLLSACQQKEIQGSSAKKG